MKKDEKLRLLYYHLEASKQVQVELLNNGDKFTIEEREAIVEIWKALDIACDKSFALLQTNNIKIPEPKNISFVKKS